MRKEGGRGERDRKETPRRSLGARSSLNSGYLGETLVTAMATGSQNTATSTQLKGIPYAENNEAIGSSWCSINILQLPDKL